MTGLVIDHWTEDRRKTYMSRTSFNDLGTKPGTTKRTNETRWRSAEKLSHPVVTVCRHAIQSFCVCHMNCLYTVSLLLHIKISNICKPEEGWYGQSKYCYKKTIHVVMNQLCSSLWTSRFWLSLQCYRDQSPILERRGGGTRLYTGNFNPISSSFIQKCSQKYSLCLLRKGIKLRELTKRNFALRRGILRVKRSLKIVLSQEPTTHRLLPQRTLSALGSGRKV